MASRAHRSPSSSRSNLPFWNDEARLKPGFFSDRRGRMQKPDQFVLSQWIIPPIVVPALIVVALIVSWAMI